MKKGIELISKSFRQSLDFPRKYLNTWRYKISDCIASTSLDLKSQGLNQQKVSVVIPTLSKNRHLKHLLSLEKLLVRYLPNQDHKNYEAIVWCDGFNKKVEDLVNKLNDDRIKIYHTDSFIGKHGHPQTRLGIDVATGDFFVRINDDNRPYKNYLSSLVEGFNQEIGIVYGRIIYKGQARKVHSNSLSDSFVIPGDKKGELKRRNVDCMCYMVKMDLAKRYINYWDDRFAADWFFLEALLTNKTKSKFIDRIIGEKF